MSSTHTFTQWLVPGEITTEIMHRVYGSYAWPEVASTSTPDETAEVERCLKSLDQYIVFRKVGGAELRATLHSRRLGYEYLSRNVRIGPHTASGRRLVTGIFSSEPDTDSDTTVVAEFDLDSSLDESTDLALRTLSRITFKDATSSEETEETAV